MAECLGRRERGNVSPENVKRWTEKLLNVLVSSTARNKFKSYLTAREFDEGKSLLEFWEMCDSFLKKREDNFELDEHGVLKEAEEIAQFAEDNIPFDAQMKSLKDALDSGEAVKIEKVISEAKQSAAEMLEYKGYYKGFCQYLLQEKGLLRKGD